MKNHESILNLPQPMNELKVGTPKKNIAGSKCTVDAIYIRILKKVAFLFLLGLNLAVYSQSKITYLYEKDLLSPDAETILAGNLKAYNLEYASNIDLNRKCDYYFASLTLENNQIYLEIKDCYDQSKGKAVVGKKNQIDIPQAYAGAVAYLTNDILQNPDKYNTMTSKSEKVESENEHASRYFFAPSAYNLKKGELYGATNYFLAYDFQYGLTDNFSLGMGSTIAAFPFYITPKYSFELNKKSRISIGDMLVLGTWGSDFTANIAYAVYTHGNSNKNISVGLAYLNANGSAFDNTLSQPILNISGMAQLSNYMYFVSENYFSFGMKNDKTFQSYSTNGLGQTVITNYEYQYQSNIAMGALGFRFINKKKDVQSIQFGLAYFINNKTVDFKNGKTPPELDEPYYSGPKNEGRQFFIPTLTLCFKFGKKV